MKIVKQLVAAAVIAGAMFGARYAAANGDDLTAFTLANGKESRENAAGGFRIFILGNSITTVTGWVHEWGMAASAREKDYAHLIIADMEASLGLQANYVIRNIARLEQSDDWDLATEMSEEIALGADYIVIALGENLGSRDTVTYENRLYALANAFRTGGRRPRIVFRSPFWNNTTVANITRHVADSVGAKYVDAGPLGNDDSNKAIGEYDDAGVAQHPNDKGMLAIANLILPALKAPDPVDDPSDETASAFNSIDPVGGFADLGSEGASEPDAPLVGGTPYRLDNGEFVHVFTVSGSITAPSDTNLHVTCFAVGGGGGGASLVGGGGGAGGVVLRELDLPAGSQLTIVIGAGGAGGTSGYYGANGGDTTIKFQGSNECAVTAFGGGGGAGWGIHPGDGGSGGGGNVNVPALTSRPRDGQGNAGGVGGNGSSGGGGGAGGPGADGANGQAGNGGPGILCAITGITKRYATGGGAGGTSSPTSPMTTAAAGAGGSDGVCGGNGSTGNGGAGLANTGAGGGGGGWPNTPSGGAGGSGIVVIRYTYTGRIGPPPLNYGQPFEVSSSATECPLAADAATTGAVAAVRGVGGDWTRLPCGDFVHVFSTVGGHDFLAPKGAGNGPVTIHYLVVGGGGAGGWFLGGGGGGGGVRSGCLLANPGEKFTITVGRGGHNWSGYSSVSGGSGFNSKLQSSDYNIIAHGGGGGGCWCAVGADGGSGGGGSGDGVAAGGAGTDGEGYSGGSNPQGGGGGACGAGLPNGGHGGDGYLSGITGTVCAYGAGGGGGKASSPGSSNRGLGGSQGYVGQGGNGRDNNGGSTLESTGSNGANGYGGGGGGSDWQGARCGGFGGSGVVILRYAATCPSNASGREPSLVRYGDYSTAEGTGVTVASSDAPLQGGNEIRQIGKSTFVHRFTSGGTLVNNSGRARTVEYLLVGGGGAGGNLNGGAGGGGGVRYGKIKIPSGQSLSVTVGAGGAVPGAQGANGNNGGNTVIQLGETTVTAHGGGGGGGHNASGSGGATGGGGSHGGSGDVGGFGGAALYGDEGYDGGSCPSVMYYYGGNAGGGGAGGPGAALVSESDEENMYFLPIGGNGGPGATSAITGEDVVYGGGGAGSGAYCDDSRAHEYNGMRSFGGMAGAGGGGCGMDIGSSGRELGSGKGADGLGGGGAGAAYPSRGNGCDGGSGVAIFRYKTVGTSGLLIYFR